MTDKFEEHSCDFKNESECEEEMDDEGLESEEETKNHFEDEED